MQQYNKEQLTGKSIDELRAIASEFGINTSGLDEMGLIYEILDQSAVATASDRAANAKTATSTSRKRTRIKTVDRVYTANKEKAKKVDKTMKVSVDDSLFGSLSDEEKALIMQAQESEKKAADEQKDTATPAPAQPAADAIPATPKKRGRKPKAAAAALQEGQKEAAGKGETTATAVTSEENLPLFNESEKGSEGEVSDEKNLTTKEKADMNAKENQPKTSADDDFIVMEMASDKKAAASTNISALLQEELRENAGKASKDNQSDFIILEDIPAEESVVNRSPMNFFKDFRNNSLVTSNGSNETYSGTGKGNAAVAAPRQKTYDFGDLLTVTGVFEAVDNYGFLRSSDYNYLASPDDIYVNQAQVKHYGLKTGDVVEGNVRPPREGEKFFTIISIKHINGCDPAVVRDRVSFEYLTPLFPDEKFKLCRGDGSDTQSSRIVDLFSPIGKGQRALIVAQPKTGKTLLMKDIANSIARNHPEAYLIMLLIDERPEEVTDMSRTVNAEVVASTFDAPAENHVKIAGLVLEKAKRMVECGHDVVIFLDSITRLARAYNTVSPASGKVLTGGVDANSLQKPKRFFGAARNIEGGGSLTIIATALIDTGSKMDEVIFEEFKGTGNMELQLDRTLSNKRIFPAVNLVASSTRRDDLLQDQTTLNRMWVLRKHIADMTPMEAMTFMQDQLAHTKNNEEFLISMNS